LEKLKADAVRILRANDTGRYTKPAPRLYPHQWNWDSALIAIGWSYLDERRAQEEILSLFRGQWKNGMIPHIIFNPESKRYHPNPEFWNTTISQMSPAGIQTSGITQPPVLSLAAYEVYQNSLDKPYAKEFLKKIYPKLMKYHAFFYKYRDLERRGLVAIIHPWESGLDNSPLWDEALGNIVLERKPDYERVDDLLVSAEQRPSREDYDKYTYLVEVFRSLEYDSQDLLNESPFLIQPVLFNSVLYASNICLKKIGDILEEDTHEIDDWIRTTKNRINTRLWDGHERMYFDYDIRSNLLIRKKMLTCFMPMFAGIPDQKIADELVTTLKSTSTYWPENGYPFCNVPMEEPEFNPMNYWRGPVWINMNWFLIRGLRDYGYHEDANMIMDKTLELVSKHGFCEYFNPFTGKGYGTDQFSWTSALIIDLIESYYQMK
jgi:glycogen debranching enzyme